MDTNARLELLERTSQDLTTRLGRLEVQLSSSLATTVVTAPAPASRPVPLGDAQLPPAEAPAPAVAHGPSSRRAKGPRGSFKPLASTAARITGGPPHLSLEDLLAGRVLAWSGAVAVLVGIVLLFAIAVSRGWIGESARTFIGYAVSCALVAGGYWLHERRGRTDAALAATAAGLAGLFVTSVVAARVYELFPVELGMLVALGTGALSTLLALRWQAHGIAALGILAGLVAPILVGAPLDGETIAILFAAALSATAICVRERWDWLALAAWAAVTPQWLGYLGVYGSTPVATLATLVGFGTIAAASAVGFELRKRTPAVRPVSVLLLVLNGFLLALAGWALLDQSEWWLVALAVTHVATGVALLRNRRASRAVGVLAAALGAVLADLALTQLLDGPALTFSWAVSAVGFAVLVRRNSGTVGELDDTVAGAGLAAHIALALSHAVMNDFSAMAILMGGEAAVAESASLAALAAACLASGLVVGDRPGWRWSLHGVGLAVTAYLVAANLDGTALVCAWAVEAVVLAQLASRSADREFALGAAVAHLALAGTHTLQFEAPVTALLDGLADPAAAAIALGACAVAAGRSAFMAARCLEVNAGGEEPGGEKDAADRLRALILPLAAAAALLTLHLASTQLVTAAGAGPRAQTLLSVLWGAIGVVALVAGLLRDLAPLRTGALALLLMALAKVFLYDLAALTPIARVVSFIVLGLLLLVGAFAWQRIRPRPLPDLREVAPAVRG